jgi:hypothetical protein
MQRAVFLAVMLSCCAACGDSTPTSPSSTPQNATERFDDIINVRESKFYPFSVGSTGTTTINLASLSPLDHPGVVNATMEIGWGKAIKDDSGNVVGCDLAKVVQTAPGLTAQLSDSLSAATDYCANIADVGGLRESVNFSIRVSHP